MLNVINTLKVSFMKGRNVTFIISKEIIHFYSAKQIIWVLVFQKDI